MTPPSDMVYLAFGFGPTELIIILVIVLVLFGASKIPKLARGLGRGITEFKQGLNEGNKGSDDTLDKIEDDSEGKKE